MKYRFDTIEKLTNIHDYFLDNYAKFIKANPDKFESSMETKNKICEFGLLISELSLIEMDNEHFEKTLNEMKQSKTTWEGHYKKRITELETENNNLKDAIGNT